MQVCPARLDVRSELAPGPEMRPRSRSASRESRCGEVAHISVALGFFQDFGDGRVGGVGDGGGDDGVAYPELLRLATCAKGKYTRRTGDRRGVRARARAHEFELLIAEAGLALAAEVRLGRRPK
eukprot:5692848-Pleurochrysis_carterae.AAC.1